MKPLDDATREGFTQAKERPVRVEVRLGGSIHVLTITEAVSLQCALRASIDAAIAETHRRQGRDAERTAVCMWLREEADLAAHAGEIADAIAFRKHIKKGPEQ